jgi:hypothetical protein
VTPDPARSLTRASGRDPPAIGARPFIGGWPKGAPASCAAREIEESGTGPTLVKVITLADALIEEATVDAYNDQEQVTGLFTMLDEHLAVPFDTELLGVTVTVNKLDLTVEHEIIAICCRDGHTQAIALLDLPLPVPRPDGAEWIDAFRRWRR